MGQIDYSYFSSIPQGGNGGNGPRVGYFSLKNDGDEAVVRIMHDSPADFDIVATHQHNIGGKFKRVNCIRDPKEPVDNCPFCAAGKPIQYRMYVHLLEYRPGEDGRIQAIPKVWERPAAYANSLKNLLTEYGPLSDLVFKVKRNGAAGSTSTTYDLIYANPAVYKPELYPKKADAFKDYRATGNAVIDKTYEELMAMLNEGPAPAAQAQPGYQYQAQPAYQTQPAYQAQPQQAYQAPVARTPARTYQPVAAPAAAPTPTLSVADIPDSELPFENPSVRPNPGALANPAMPAEGNTFSRPRRFYQ